MAVRVSRPCAGTSNPGGTQWTPWVQRALLRAQLRVWETTASRVCRITYTKEREFLRSVEGPSRIWQHTERHMHVNKLRLGKAVSEKIGGKSAHHHSKGESIAVHGHWVGYSLVVFSQKCGIKSQRLNAALLQLNS